MIFNTIMSGGGGGSTKTILVDMPPYASLYGRYTKGGNETSVGWPSGESQVLEIPVVLGAFYELRLNVSILVGESRRSVDVYSYNFTATDETERISMIPQDAVFFFGWEHPDYVRQTEYWSSGSSPETKMIHRSTDTSSGTVWSVAQVDLMSLNKQEHCYDANMYLVASGATLHSLGYVTPVLRTGGKRYLTCLADLWWPNESSTSTNQLMRYDYHAQGNNANPDTTYANFWAASVGSGNHTNITYTQMKSNTLPSGQPFLSYPQKDLLRCKGFIDLNALTSYTNTTTVRTRFALRFNQYPRAGYQDGCYYRIYSVMYSDDLLFPEI